jgi:hypothetical protein
VPKSTDTLLEPKLAAAKSCRPSPLKSPTVTEKGPLAVAKFRAAWKLPVTSARNVIQFQHDQRDPDLIQIAHGRKIAVS